MTAIDQSNANQNKHDNQPVKFDMIYFTLASEGLVLYYYIWASINRFQNRLGIGDSQVKIKDQA